MLIYFLQTLKDASLINKEMLGSFSKKAQQLHAYMKLSAVLIWRFVKCSYHFIIFHSYPFLNHVFYFAFISFAGFLALKILKPKNEAKRLKNLDLFFTSVSASTVSSMGTIEMEVFSDPQLWVLVLLMLIGGTTRKCRFSNQSFSDHKILVAERIN